MTGTQREARKGLPVMPTNTDRWEQDWETDEADEAARCPILSRIPEVPEWEEAYQWEPAFTPITKQVDKRRVTNITPKMTPPQV